MGNFTVIEGSEAGVDLVWIQTFLLYYVNQVVLMPYDNVHKKAKEVCIKTRSEPQPHIHLKTRVLSPEICPGLVLREK